MAKNVGLENLFGLNGVGQTPEPQITQQEVPVQVKDQPQPAAKASADSTEAAKAYKLYIDSVLSLEQNRKRLREERQRLGSFSERKTRYLNVWSSAGDAIRAEAERQQTDEEIRIENRRSDLRRTAENEKMARLNDVDRERDGLRQRLYEAERAENENAINRQRINADLQAAESYTVPSSKPRPELSAQVNIANTKDYLSPNQKALAAMPPQEFCGMWAPTTVDLKKMEEGLWETDYYKTMIGAEVEPGPYKFFSRMAWLIVSGVMFLLLLLALVIKAPFTQALSYPAIYLGTAAICHLILTVIYAIYKSTKKEKSPQSGFTGIFIIIVSAVAAAIALPNLDLNLLNIFNVFILGIASGFFIYSFLNTKLMHSLMLKIPPVKRLIYRRLYKKIDEYEDKRRRNAGLDVLAKGQVDAMIVCVLNHNSYIDMMSYSEREQIKRNCMSYLQALDESDASIRQQKAAMKEEENDINELYSQVLEMNRQTDEKLAADLRALDSQYGKSVVPDTSRRSNFSYRYLEDLAAYEEQLGISSQPETYSDAVRECDKCGELLRVLVAQAAEKVNRAVAAISFWLSNHDIPPLSNGDGTYNYNLEPFICMMNALTGSSEPTILHYDYKPMTFVYQDNIINKGGGTIRSNAVIFIRQIWQAFTKIAPPQLINFSIVNEAQDFKLLMSDTKALIRDFDKYYMMSEPVDPDTNVKSIRGRFTREDTAELCKEIDDKIVRIQEYSKRNSVIESDIVHVNDHMSSGNLHDANAWNIVFYIVPPRSYESFSDSDNRNWLTGQLNNYNVSAKRFGFIPIIFRAETDISEKWKGIVKQAEELGVNYRINLETLDITK